MSSVIIALVVGVFAGALVVWLATRGQGNPAVLHSQSEIKARLDDTLTQVQRLGAIFANAAQRGRAGELVLENLLEATGMDRHRDFELQVATEGARPDVVLKLPGRGRLVIDAKFPLDDFQRAATATGEDERRKALAAHAKAVAGHVSALAKRDYPGKIKDSIDFTVCFVPAEDLLGAADLHQRFALTMRHLQKTGRSLSTAVNSYNALVGSLESRVLPQLERLEELGIVAYGTQVPQAQTVEAQPRPVPSAPDPLEGAEA